MAMGHMLFLEVSGRRLTDASGRGDGAPCSRRSSTGAVHLSRRGPFRRRRDPQGVWIALP